MPKLSLAGIFPPIPTPFKADGHVDYDHLQHNMDRWNRDPLAGYVVCGSNGEYTFLTTDERVELIQAVRQVIPADRLLIASPIPAVDSAAGACRTRSRSTSTATGMTTP